MNEKMMLAWRRWAVKNNLMSDDGTIWEPDGLFTMMFDCFKAGWKAKKKVKRKK